MSWRYRLYQKFEVPKYLGNLNICHALQKENTNEVREWKCKICIVWCLKSWHVWSVVAMWDEKGGLCDVYDLIVLCQIWCDF